MKKVGIKNKLCKLIVLFTLSVLYPLINSIAIPFLGITGSVCFLIKITERKKIKLHKGK
jgi:hypothetical protein